MVSGREGRPTAVVLPVTNTIPAGNWARFVREAAVAVAWKCPASIALGRSIHIPSSAGLSGNAPWESLRCCSSTQGTAWEALGPLETPVVLYHSCNYTSDSFKAIWKVNKNRNEVWYKFRSVSVARKGSISVHTLYCLLKMSGCWYFCSKKKKRW